MPGLMIFKATLRWTGWVCSAMKTAPMPPLADLLQQLVRTNDGAWAFRERLVIDGRAWPSGAMFEDAAGMPVGGEQLLDALAQGGIAGTHLV